MTKPTQTLRNFPLHTIESAPEGAKEPLNWYQENFQMVPNLSAVLAEAPALLKSYWQTQLNLVAMGSLSSQENNIVQMSVAHANRCQYCVAGHTAFGKSEFFNNTDEQLNAIRKDLPFEEPKYNALRDFTLAVVAKHGRVSDQELEAFYAAGYTQAQALDVVTCIAAKVMSNYANQIVLTPVDEPFAALTEGLPYKEERGVKVA
ncbi:MAG: carboxymuconolactone decarboxylase family protein [Myxococcota bacterium]